MKKVKCELWLGTATRYFKFGSFDSLAECKRYIDSCGEWLSCYKEIKRV